MAIFWIGIAILGALLGLFHFKNRLKSPLLARIAYSGLVARLGVIALAMIAIGLLFALGNLFS